MTSTELFEKAGISLSTVNHHVKTLIQVGLVIPDLESKESGGAALRANRDVYREVLQKLLHDVE